MVIYGGQLANRLSSYAVGNLTQMAPLDGTPGVRQDLTYDANDRMTSLAETAAGDATPLL